MPPHAGWAEPVSRTPVPHCQRAAQPVCIHDEHRATIGQAFNRLAALERKEARAFVTELDRSGNRERHSDWPVHTSTGLSLHPPPSDRDEGPLTSYDDSARRLQLPTALPSPAARPDATHLATGQ